MADCRSRSKRFAGQCRVSDEVAARVPINIQAALWRLIGEKRRQGEELDSTQSFEIDSQTDVHGEEVLVVVHRQDNPAFVDVTVLRRLPEKFVGRVVVVDDGERAVMLLPKEAGPEWGAAR